MFELTSVTKYLGQNITYSVIYVIGAILAQAITSFMIGKIVHNIAVQQEAYSPSSERSGRLNTLKSVLNNASSVVIWGMAVIMLMAEWGVDITPLITGAGVIGLAVGFGSQTLVKDVVSGLFILSENQFNVGERIQIAGVTGTVQQINLRTTIVCADDGSLHIVPNSTITNVTKNLPPYDPNTAAAETETVTS